MQVRFLGWEDPWRKSPWRRAWQPTLIFLPRESHGQRSLEGYSPWGRKESGMTEQLSTHDNIEFQEIYLMLSLENKRKEKTISKIGAWN